MHSCIMVISDVQIFKILNRIVTSVFDSFRNKYKYSKFSNTYRHQFLTYLNRMTPTLETAPTNQQNQHTLWPTKY